MTGTKEYRTWENIKKRCHNPNTPKYTDYGARGIAVCAEWRDSFEQFFADMGPAPGAEYSIERIDNNGPYSAQNCRWATPLEQANNQRKNINLTHDGRTLSLTAWARELGFERTCLQARYDNAWPVDRLLTTPPNVGNRPNNVMLTFKGETLRAAEWCRRLGIRKAMLHKRLARGMSVEEALTRPSRKA